MKKRAMKKWIPKNTLYCLNCKWRWFVKIVYLNKTNCKFADECSDKCWSSPETSCRNRVYRCDYLSFTDWNEETLLWDGCKECGEHLD